jgi:hypothetical protein
MALRSHMGGPLQTVPTAGDGWPRKTKSRVATMFERRGRATLFGWGSHHDLEGWSQWSHSTGRE